MVAGDCGEGVADALALDVADRCADGEAVGALDAVAALDVRDIVARRSVIVLVNDDDSDSEMDEDSATGDAVAVMVLESLLTVLESLRSPETVSVRVRVRGGIVPEGVGEIDSDRFCSVTVFERLGVTEEDVESERVSSLGVTTHVGDITLPLSDILSRCDRCDSDGRSETVDGVRVLSGASVIVKRYVALKEAVLERVGGESVFVALSVAVRERSPCDLDWVRLLVLRELVIRMDCESMGRLRDGVRVPDDKGCVSDALRAAAEFDADAVDDTESVPSRADALFEMVAVAVRDALAVIDALLDDDGSDRDSVSTSVCWVLDGDREGDSTLRLADSVGEPVVEAVARPDTESDISADEDMLFDGADRVGVVL